MREQLLRFIGELRAGGARISVAETIDAMHAVAAAGFERGPMREALAATLIKDEADRPLFDRTYVNFFGRANSARPDKSELRSGVPATSGGPQHAGTGMAARPREELEPSIVKPTLRSKMDKPAHSDEARGKPRGDAEAETEHARGERDSGDVAGNNTAQQARLAAVERVPFEHYSEFYYETARDLLALLVRRFRVRLGRRLKLARRGRVDFRRTIRAATQRGGTLIDLRSRARRPRRIDVLVLADISGSVRYAATLMLSLVAGVSESFHRVSSLVFIDHLAEADFEDGHLVMTPTLDPFARSDFGRVLEELWERRSELLGPATLVIIMGDARNNRRPARADLLGEIAHRCRAVYWLNPEARERWGAGDSTINQYARQVAAVVPSRTLAELERALLEAV